MKIKEYAQMMKYLTRPKAPREEATATWNKLESEFNDERKQKLKKDKQMDDEKTLAEKQLIKVATQPDSRGMFQRLVKENEAAELGKKIIDSSPIKLSEEKKKGVMKAVQPQEKLFENLPILNQGINKPKKFDWAKQKKHTENMLEKFEDTPDKRFINKTLKPVERNEDPRAVAFNPTTQIFSNKDRTVAFKSYDEAQTWNKSIGVIKTKYYPDEATPEQVGALAERLERSRQINGADGRYDKPKAIIKKKKIVSTPMPKINFSPMPELPQPRIKTADEIRIEQNFKQLLRDSEQKQFQREFGGIRGLKKHTYE
jgi:hypothetical protein|tara:strand:- start:192 stop:1133 length:942 start_codon:yes stop_codon:yes gene_type:complete